MEINVRQNDSFWYYSQLFNVPLLLIENSNPQVNPKRLMIGQSIQIPGYLIEQYTVKSNDTAWTIAMENNLQLDSLYVLNQSIDLNHLQIGQKINIPQRVTNMLILDIDNYSYEKLSNDIELLQSVYPFIFRKNIGHSVMGKDLIELKIGVGSKSVHLNGSFHANEWITTPIIMVFLNQYALAVTNSMPIRGIDMYPLFVHTMLSIVPMVNPDGVNLVIGGSTTAGEFEQSVLEINNNQTDFSNWKANIHGVDLNNQFPALWELEAERKPKTPKPRDYPGPYPLSEPESIAMAELTRQSNFERVNAFHTQGEEIYWGFQGLEPPISEVIVNEYVRVSGYVAVKNIDSYAGYKDWFIQDFRKPGFTVELGRGVNPLPIEQFQSIYQRSLGIMLANLYL